MTEASRHSDGTWDIPSDKSGDRAMSERLASSGARLSPGTQWNIDCMVRVIAPILDGHGLLDGDASWLEMRRSRSEMAGGLTVEFAPHPDETDPRFLKMRHFRFRPQRVAQSDAALGDLRAASARRAFLMRRRAAIDAGLTTEGRSLICDSVLPGLLQWAGIDAGRIADGLEDGEHLLHAPSGKTTVEPPPVDIERRGQQLVVHRLMLPGDIVYRSAHGSPSLVVRRMTSSEEDLSRMPGRPLSAALPQPVFAVDGLTVVAASCRGDTTIFTLNRPQTTLLPLP